LEIVGKNVNRWAQKKGKLPVSHRYNYLPLLPSDPGGIQQELVAQDLPGGEINISFTPDKVFLQFSKNTQKS